uniref:Uncharacterized protein n=1 Tax=Hyaloperonospora arabidopsidis (strain Emoy2) TaxID=559515 RepID=M4C369_HYAAE
MKETTEGLKCAAEGIGEFAKEVMVEIKNMAPVQADVAPIPEMPRQSTATVVVEEATEAPMEAASSREWEQVTEQDRTSAPVEEAPVVVEPVDEIKWLEELFMVRNIFAGEETSEVVDRLEQCNGNVLVVVNALLEKIGAICSQLSRQPRRIGNLNRSFSFVPEAHGRFPSPWRGRIGRTRQYDNKSTTSSSSISPTHSTTRLTSTYDRTPMKSSKSLRITVLADLVTYIVMHLRYNLWQMISLYSLGGCVRIKGWVCTYQFP